MLMIFASLTTASLLAPRVPKAACRSSPARVLVKNIAFEADETAVMDKLAAFGPVTSVRLAKASKRQHARPHQGWAWVYFDGERCARQAAASGGSLSLHGRALSIRLDMTHQSPKRAALPADEALPAADAGPQHCEEVVQRRSVLLERLRATRNMEVVQACVDALGELISRDEYKVSKAAWKRAMGAGLNRVNERHGIHSRASFSI